MNKICLFYIMVIQQKNYFFFYVLFFLFLSLTLPLFSASNSPVSWYIYQKFSDELAFRTLTMSSMEEGWIGLGLPQMIDNPLFSLSDGVWKKVPDFNVHASRTHVLQSFSSHNLWVVSYNPNWAETFNGLRINFFNGKSWQYKIFPEGIWPQTMTMVSEDEAWIGGNSGAMLHIKGDLQERFLLPLSEDVQAGSHIFKILMIPGGGGFATGANGLFAQYDGISWSPISLPEELRSIRFWSMDRAPDGRIWLAGEKGALAVYDGLSVSAVASPVNVPLHDIQMTGDGGGWCVGGDGVILKYEEGQWVNYFSPTRAVLYDIQMFSPSEGWIVGQDVILKTAPADSSFFLQKTGKINPHVDREVVGDLTAVDFNKDGFKDLFLLPPLLLFKNQGRGLFADVTTSAALSNMEEPFHSFCWGDVNGDSYPDLYLISRNDEGNRLFLNNKGRSFSPSRESVQFGGGRRNSGYFLDIDCDRDLDIYVERWIESSEIPGQDYVYYNDGFGRFTLKKTDWGKKSSQSLVLWGDLDGDMDPDAVFPRLGKGVSVYRNDGHGNLEDVSETSGLPLDDEESFETTKAHLFDADLDGDLDLLIISYKLMLFYNDGNLHFSQVPDFPSGSAPVYNFMSTSIIDTDHACDVGDINNDGRVDLVFKINIDEGQSKLFCLIRNADGSYRNIAPFMAIEDIKADQILLSDSDNDGDLDLFITRGDTGESSLFFENQLNNFDWIKVEAKGDSSNSLAIGARIRLFEAGHLNENGYLRGHRHVGMGGNPRNAHNIGYLHFGVDHNKNYDVEVLFPSGRRVVRKNVKPASHISVYEFPPVARLFRQALFSIRRVAAFVNLPAELLKLIWILGLLFFFHFYLAAKLKCQLLFPKLWFLSLLLFLYILWTSVWVEASPWSSYFFCPALYSLFLFLLLLADRYLSIWKKSQYIGHYRIVSRIAQGGMGTVFRARNVVSKATRALKLINPQILASRNGKENFLREGKIMEQFNHPNVIKVYETGEISGTCFISMEFLEGMTLAELFKQLAPLDYKTMLFLILPACKALAYIHQRGILHRDIKPENIFICQSAPFSIPDSLKSRNSSLQRLKVKLMDFGLAREMLSLTLSHSVSGTLAYMAPEYFLGGGIDIRTDIYAMGVVIYEALTGILPRAGQNEISFIQSIMRSEYFSIKLLNPEVPDLLDQIVEKMLSGNRGLRWASMEEVISALKGLSAEPFKLPKDFLPENDAVLPVDSSRFLSQYEVLKREGKGVEAFEALKIAYRTTVQQKNILKEGADKFLLKEYTSEQLSSKWMLLYERAKEIYSHGDLSIARELMIECMGIINQLLLILSEEEADVYLKTHHVEEVINFMNRL